MYKGSSLVLSSEELKRSEIETQLVQNCQQGTKNAQEKLYKYFYGYIMAISLRYASGKNEAQEITDDSFMKVFSNIGKFDPQQSFKSWLRRITVNTAIDHHRKNKRYHQVMDVEMLSIQSDECAISKLTAEDLLRVIQQLPELLRITFNMYEIEGYNHQEIAQQLGISESSSRVYLTRAKQKLRELCQAYVEGNHGR